VKPVGEHGRAGEATRWVTRRGIKVDRMASAWLIRRFIDPAAQFVFVDPDSYVPGAGDVRFDMFEGEYTHEYDFCTFEILVSRFGIDDRAVKPIGEVVHDIDVKDAKFARVETPGVASVIEGIVATHSSDEARLAAGAALFDALYVAFAASKV
jgi:hypothetical protein